MGGISSGRYRTRNRGAVEHVIRLDMRRLRQIGMVKPGARTSGAIQWSTNGRVTNSIGLAVDLTNPSMCFAKLDFTSGGEAREQVVSISADPCRFGGRCYYFRCPRTYDRCVSLHCVGGVFASRRAHRLTYASQCEDQLGRLHRARLKAEARALGTDGKPRPRGANCERLVQRWIDLEEATDDLFTVMVMRRFGGLGLRL